MKEEGRQEKTYITQEKRVFFGFDRNNVCIYSYMLWFPYDFPSDSQCQPMLSVCLQFCSSLPYLSNYIVLIMVSGLHVEVTLRHTTETIKTSRSNMV